jgi:uncharacterized membrane protein YhaH (DUF805 family)
MAFSNRKYIVLSVFIFAVLVISLSILSQFIFFSPYFVFHVPEYGILDFTLILIIASLSGLVSSLSIYRMRMIDRGISKSGAGFFGSILGVGSGACGCGSFGFAAVSVFGATGGIITSFLTNYETPLRLLSIALLCYTYFVSVKGITDQCRIVK